MRLTVGQSIGRYVIESLLGEGGMGEAYPNAPKSLDVKATLVNERKDIDDSVF